MIKLREKRGIRGPIVAPDGSGKMLRGHIAGGSVVDFEDKSLERYLVGHESADAVEKGVKPYYAAGTEFYEDGGAPGNPGSPDPNAKEKKEKAKDK